MASGKSLVLQEIRQATPERACSVPGCKVPWSAHLTKKGTLRRALSGHVRYAYGSDEVEE